MRAVVTPCAYHQLCLARRPQNGAIVRAALAAISIELESYDEGIPRLRPEGTGRRVRPGGLCAEPRASARAPRAYQRARAPAPRRAGAARVWRAGDRRARSLSHAVRA